MNEHDRDPAELPADQAEVLQRALRVSALKAEAFERLRNRTHAAWREGLERRRGRRRLAAVAAGIAAIGVTLAVLNVADPPVEAPVIARVIRMTGTPVLHAQGATTTAPVQRGTTLRSGDRIATSASGGVALELAGGASLRVRGGSKVRIERSLLVLDRGALYLDIPATAPTTLSVRAGTVHVDHFGTQFAVAIAAPTVTVSVREGSVRVRSGAADEQVAAGERLAIVAEGGFQRERIPSASADWSWAAALAPEFEIENRTLDAFLAWFVRETGRALVYATPSSRAQAQSVALHGSIAGLSPERALAAVFSTTSLEYELSEGRIVVRD